MGTLDRPHHQPDVPDEVGSAKDPQPAKPEVFPNLAGQPNEAAAAFLGLDRQDRRVPDLTGKNESLAEAGVRGLPRWKVGDRIELPDIVVRKDIGPGIKPPDYRNPDAKDTLKLEHGQEVVIGKHNSSDNPRRLAEVRHNQIIDKQTDNPPENPSGDEIVEMGNERRPRLGRLFDKATKPEVIENANDSAKSFGGRYEDLIGGPKPTGSAVGTPDRPIADQQQPAGHDWGMILVGAPAALSIATIYFARHVRAKLHESRQLDR